jgi:hypothetical protein
LVNLYLFFFYSIHQLLFDFPPLFLLTTLFSAIFFVQQLFIPASILVALPASRLVSLLASLVVFQVVFKFIFQ